MVLERDGLLVEPGRGIRGCVLSVRDGDPPEVFAGRPVLVHVALGVHRHPGRGREQPVGRVPAEVDGLGAGRQRLRLHADAEALLGAFVHGAIADDDLADSRGDRHRRLQERGTGGAPAEMGPAEETQVAAAQGTVDLDLRVVVHRVGGHPVDVARRDARVFERRGDRLDREPQLRATGGFRELGGTDPDDRRAVLQIVRKAGHEGSTTTTSPRTWWPRSFSPTTATVTSPPEAFEVTSPRRRMVSPG